MHQIDLALAELTEHQFFASRLEAAGYHRVGEPAGLLGAIGAVAHGLSRLAAVIERWAKAPAQAKSEVALDQTRQITAR